MRRLHRWSKPIEVPIAEITTNGVVIMRCLVEQSSCVICGTLRQRPSPTCRGLVYSVDNGAHWGPIGAKCPPCPGEL